MHIHRGNYPSDTTGCVLLGKDVGKDQNSVKNSTEAFDNFMEVTKSIDGFDLYVTSIYGNSAVFDDPEIRGTHGQQDPTKPVQSTFGEKLKWKALDIIESVKAAWNLSKRDESKTKNVLKKIWNGVSMVLTLITIFKGGKK